MSTPSLIRGIPIDAEFVERPNRFITKARLKNGDIVDAFMPNPGRLGELLLPDAPLLLEKASVSTIRKTKFTVAAVYHGQKPIGLNTLRTNSIVAHLLQNRLIPGLKGTRIVGSEVRYKNSRFDFLVENSSQEQFYLEVKSVTLAGNGIAMFPDAITERGKRHLRELSHLSNPRTNSLVIFLVQGKDKDLFMPDYHTDIAFARTMMDVRGEVTFVPVAIEWDETLKLQEAVKNLTIPWQYIATQLSDSGGYILLIQIDRHTTINVGSLGLLSVEPGYYIYVGSAMKGLTARLARHVRRQKTMRWHIDYLRKISVGIRTFPIRSPTRIELPLASDIGQIYKPCFPGFGSSDSVLHTHLFYSRTDPAREASFQNILQNYRFIRP